MDEESTSVQNVSRRRLAFRPPTNPNPARIVGAMMTSSGGVVAEHVEKNEPSTSQADISTELKPDEVAKKKTAKAWTHEDTMAYYEALKVHGKDFESAAKTLLKRKIMKDKDQIKNYFYNSLKILKQILAINEDDWEEVPKDAKELFLVLNACEWKKRTNNGKFVSEKLKELLLEGLTTVRLNKKTVQIKTPPCASLVKWFTKSRRAEKFPTELTIVLKPVSYGDESLIRSRFQNPLLKVKMSTNDKLSKLIDLLQRKWRITEADDDNLEDIKIRLFPSSSTDVGSLSVVETEISPFVALSMNKLRRELRQEKLVKKGTTTGVVAANAPNSALNKASANINKKSSYTVLYPRPFSLTDEKIREGLCMKNSAKVILAELYCTCGMTEKIELRYEIEQTRSREQPNYRIEPWKVMIGFLNKDYGESICSSSKRDEQHAAAEAVVNLERKRRERGEIEEVEMIEPPVKKIATGKVIDGAEENEMVREKARSPEVVRKEMDAFQLQLRALKSKSVRTPKSNMKPPQWRRNGKQPSSSIGSPASGPSRISSPSIPLAAPSPVPVTCQLIPKRQDVQLQAPVKQLSESEKMQLMSTPVNMSKMQNMVVKSERRTDFSHFMLSTEKKRISEEVQQKRNAQVLDSLGTPQKTPMRSQMEQLFGPEMSMSPTTCSRKSATQNCPEEEVSRCELTDILFGEISSTPTKYSNQQAPHTETTVNGTSLGFSDSEVQQSYNDMITSSEDSRDFVMQHFKYEKDGEGGKRRTNSNRRRI